jgi:hypothetical protein
MICLATANAENYRQAQKKYNNNNNNNNNAY